MVNDHQGLDIPPLQAQYMTPPPTEPPDQIQQQCLVNIVPFINEYEVNIFVDEFDRDNQSIHDQKENDETSEALIRDFSLPNDQNFKDEIQQVTLNQVYLDEVSNMTRFT